MQAIILAGGFGTRLQAVVGEVPKPMAPVAGRPFLEWLLEYMGQQGITDAVLCVHYMHEHIRRHFGETFAGVRLQYIVEEQSLGTGGAIRQALETVNPRQPVFVLNGDSMVRLDYRHMMETHKRESRLMTLATYRAEDCSRFSSLALSKGKVTWFNLLGNSNPGPVSAGFYILSPEIFAGLTLPQIFSFERDFLSQQVPLLQPAAYERVEYFIDIGIPMDYLRAQIEMLDFVTEFDEA